MNLQKCFVGIFCLFPVSFLLGQSRPSSIHTDSNIIISPPSKILHIKDILIEGNKKTRAYIIQRELTFKTGDSLTMQHLEKELEKSRSLLVNTQLFFDVTLAYKPLLNYPDSVTITVSLKERWYLFPLPYFKLIDRNLGQWWGEQNKSLERINYGIKFNYYNATGRNDRIGCELISGYTQQINLSYALPYLGKSSKNGLGVSFGYSRQREINYTTKNNKQLFFQDGEFIQSAKRIALSYIYRPDLYRRIYFSLGYFSNEISDTVRQLNPNYFPNNDTKLNFLELRGIFQYTNLDYNPFPTKGFRFEASLMNKGFTQKMNTLQLSMETVNAFSLPRKFFFQWRNYGVVKSTNSRSYYTQSLFGYGDAFLRGLEAFVIDGSSGVISNSTLYKKILKLTIKNPIRSKTHDKFPIAFYIKSFVDVGYAYNRYGTTEDYSNRLLTTAGFGLDMVTVYDLVIRTDYSFNQFGGYSFGIRFRTDF